MLFDWALGIGTKKEGMKLSDMCATILKKSLFNWWFVERGKGIYVDQKI